MVSTNLHNVPVVNVTVPRPVAMLDCKQFSFVGSVTSFSKVELPAFVGNWMFNSTALLHLQQYSTVCMVRCVHLDDEWLCNVGLLQDRGVGHTSLEVVEAVLANKGPQDCTMFLGLFHVYTPRKFMQGCCNVCKILDELLIVGCQPWELSNVVNCYWTNPILNSCKFVRVYTDFTFHHDVTAKLDGNLKNVHLSG